MDSKETIVQQMLELLKGLSYEEILHITMKVREISREKCKLEK